jgi:hypothetical protein
MKAFVILILATWFFVPSLHARLWSMPNLTELLRATVIVHAKAADLTITPAGWTSTLTIKNGTVLRGSAASELITENQCAPQPEGAISYLIFLKEHDGKLDLQNDGCSMIGIGGDVKIAPEDCNDDKALVALLCSIFIQERAPQCALLQSYFLRNCGKENAERVWRSFDPTQANPELCLAYLHIGLQAVGARAFEKINLPMMQGYFAKGSQTFYAERVEAAIVTWTYKNASAENAPAILKFAQILRTSSKSMMITAVSSHIPNSSLPEIVSIFKQVQAEKPNMVQYACVQAVFKTLKGGKGIPAIDTFMGSPKRYIDEAISALKKEGLW